MVTQMLHQYIASSSCYLCEGNVDNISSLSSQGCTGKDTSAVAYPNESACFITVTFLPV